MIVMSRLCESVIIKLLWRGKGGGGEAIIFIKDLTIDKIFKLVPLTSQFSEICLAEIAAGF